MGTITVNGNMDVADKVTVEQQGILNLCGNWFVGDMRINGGVVYVIPYSDSLEGSGKFFLECNQLTIEADGSINADGSGGDTRGIGADGHGSGGGGYGGKGGNGNEYGNPTAGGGTYGDNFSLTIEMGSRGGNDGEFKGGKGGGSISIISNRDIAIHGTITANGSASGPYCGGGSGGGVLILSRRNIELAGTIAANGHNGQTYGGGGGGGRIKLFYETGVSLNDIAERLSVNSGGTVDAQPGQNGTIWEDEAFSATRRPTFKFNVIDTSVETDNRDDDLSCIIELSVDNFATIYQTYDQDVSVQGWSKVDYKSGDEAEFTPTEDLPQGVYQWRAAARDRIVRGDNSLVRSFTLGTSLTIEVKASPSSLPPDGESTSLITAAVTSPEGEPVKDEVVVMNLNGDGTLSQVTNKGDGTYTATYTAGTVSGTVTITAKATKLNAFGTVEIKLGCPREPCEPCEICKPCEPCKPCDACECEPSDVTTNTLVVTGTVYNQTGKIAENGLLVEVSITTQGLIAKDGTGKTAGDGQYSVTFFDMLKPVAKVGDEILVTVKDAQGKLIGQNRHTLTAAELEATNTQIDVTPTKAIEIKPVTVTLTLRKGINVISVPVKAEKGLRMSDLAQNIGKDNLAVIIRYDYTQDKFISYLPTFPDDSPANATVKPNEGYIVVMKAEKEVEFEGTTVSEKNPSEDEIAAPACGFARLLREPPLHAGRPSLMPLILSSDNQSHKTKSLVSEAKRFSEAKLLNEVNISIPSLHSRACFVVIGNVSQEDTGEALNEVSVKIRNLRTGQTVENITGTLAGLGNYVATFVASKEEFMTRFGDKLEITTEDLNHRLTIVPLIHTITPDDISDWMTSQTGCLLCLCTSLCLKNPPCCKTIRTRSTQRCGYHINSLKTQMLQLASTISKDS